MRKSVLVLCFVPLLLPLAATSAFASQEVRSRAITVGPPAPAEAQAPATDWYALAPAPPFVSELFERDTPDVVWAGNATFPVDEPPVIPRELSKPFFDADGAFLPGWFLVHFEAAVRPVDKQFLDLLTGPVRRADGSSLARWYVPNQTLVAWIAEPAMLDLLEAHERVDWFGRYEPAYKLDPSIGSVPLTSPERTGRAFYRLDVDVIPGHPLEDVARQVLALGGVVQARVEERGAREYDVRFLVVDVVPELVTRLAWIEGVRMIQERGDGLAQHDLSGGGKLQNRTLNVDDGTSSPIVNAARFPLWVTHNLQGQGQLVGVVDTSLDWNNVGTTGCGFGYPDTAIQNYGFADPVTATLLLPTIGAGGVSLKVPRADLLGGATLLGTAANEHGCGVAGAALGDFYGNNASKWWEHDVDTWESWAPSNFSGLLGPGIAHEAQLYFTPVMDSVDGFRWESPGEFEANMSTTLTNMANAGVCATNHSVGLAEASNTYTQTTVVHDTKAYDHPGMLQCMAAGNDGAGVNKLTSQAVSKNGMAVGASDDVLKPEDRASFSSTGPRFDGARKPDIMAPGTDTFARTGGVQSLLILPDTNGSSAASCSYQWTSGTSFASPTMAGAAALVHQYFQEGRYAGAATITDPSAALMKAMLVNAGHRLTGANLDGVYPGNYQGWGEPSLVDVLDFGTGARRLAARDIASAQGFTSAASANHTYLITVNSSSETLKVALAWTDEPGSAGTGKKLINDLDLRVTSPGGATYLGNVFNTTAGTSITGGAADTLNNVEGVIVPNPALGTWTVTVDPGPGNYASGQGYGLVVTGDVTEGGGGGPTAPTAEFSGTPTSGTAPLNVSFSDLSSGSVTSWAWTFGDGGTSTAQNPSHVYASAGTYTVTLTVTGPGGSDGETKAGYVSVGSPPVGGGTYYISFDTTTTVPGLGSVADEDVVTYSPATGTWAWYFDGSDVGLASTDINALHVLDSGSIVFSIDSASFSIPGMTGGPSGTTMEDSDLAIFHFTSSPGSVTAGTFQFIFDGSDVGLTTAGEDVDGIYEFPTGGLAVSVLTSGSVTGAGSFQDEDVLFFSATSYGSATSGTWSWIFDGSDVGFADTADEDLNAIAFDAGGDLLFSTLGNWSAAGGAGADEDIGRFQGVFGTTTSGSAALELDLSALGIDPAEDIDGLAFRP